MVFRKAKSHADKKSKLAIMRSTDAKTWDPLAELKLEKEDIRDPKLVILKDKLFLYALKNKSFLIKTYTTIYCHSEDGETGTPFEEVEPMGWLFWRPKSTDNENWYVVASRHGEPQTALFRSNDGIHWTRISIVYEGLLHDEYGIHFMNDQKLIGAGRINGKTESDVIGGSTDSSLIGTSQKPFEHWHIGVSHVSRLDGPNLFSLNNQIYAIGRFEPDSILKRGNMICRKRTSLFKLDPQKLTYLSDLPSCGDTSYAGIVIRGDHLFVSYYTNRPDRDYPWFMGLFKPARIRMAKINISSLKSL